MVRRADAADAEATAALARAHIAEAARGEAETRAANAETKTAAAEAKIDEARARARDAEAARDEAETRARDAKESAAAAERERLDAEARAEGLKATLRSARDGLGLGGAWVERPRPVGVLPPPEEGRAEENIDEKIDERRATRTRVGADPANANVRRGGDARRPSRTHRRPGSRREAEPMRTRRTIAERAGAHLTRRERRRDDSRTRVRDEHGCAVVAAFATG